MKFLLKIFENISQIITNTIKLIRDLFPLPLSQPITLRFKGVLRTRYPTNPDSLSVTGTYNFRPTIPNVLDLTITNNDGVSETVTIPLNTPPGIGPGPLTSIISAPNLYQAEFVPSFNNDPNNPGHVVRFNTISITLGYPITFTSNEGNEACLSSSGCSGRLDIVTIGPELNYSGEARHFAIED